MSLCVVRGRGRAGETEGRGQEMCVASEAVEKKSIGHAMAGVVLDSARPHAHQQTSNRATDTSKRFERASTGKAHGRHYIHCSRGRARG